MELPGGNQIRAQVEQQIGHTRRAGGGGVHAERVDDLGRPCGILGIDTIKEGQHITKQGSGLVDGEEGVEAIEGGVAGGGRKQ